MAVLINEEVLAKAVQAKIRPLLVDEGYLDKRENESYHHAKVIPTAHPLLSAATPLVLAAANIDGSAGSPPGAGRCG